MILACRAKSRSAFQAALPDTMHTSPLRIAARVIGTLSIIAAVLGLLGWLQGGDPDCILDTDVLLQIRMCDPEQVGEPDVPPLVHLVLTIGLLLFGAYCLWRGSRRDGGPVMEPPQAPRK
jgi:hypothetical protein